MKTYQLICLICAVALMHVCLAGSRDVIRDSKTEQQRPHLQQRQRYVAMQQATRQVQQQHRAQKDALRALRAPAVPKQATAAAPKAAPPNDMFANRIAITGAQGTTHGSNEDATLEPQEPLYYNGTGANTVWWTWTAPADGHYAFDTFGSDFDTILALWQGTSINALTSVTGNDEYDGSQSLCVINAKAGNVYQIQVNGYADDEFGDITLNWYPVTVTYEEAWTNSWSDVWLTIKGTALNQPQYVIYSYGEGKDPDGNELWWDSSFEGYGPASVESSKNQKIVDQAPFPEAPSDAFIMDFDGKQVLVGAGNWFGGAAQLMVYNVAKNAFTLAGKVNIEKNAYSAWLTKSGVYIHLYNSRNDSEGLQLWGKGLKKLAWELPLKEGYFSYIYDNGVAFFSQWFGDTETVTVTKKTKEICKHTIPQDAWNWVADNRGGLLYWKGAGDKSGMLMTLLNAKGGKTFENEAFPEFDSCLYNGQQIWLRKGDWGETVTLMSYKPGTTPVKNGEATVPNYRDGGIMGSTSYSVSYYDGATTVRGHDKTMSEAWSKTVAGYFWEFFDKDIYSICRWADDEDIYSMFKKDKDFCVHRYPYSE